MSETRRIEWHRWQNPSITAGERGSFRDDDDADYDIYKRTWDDDRRPRFDSYNGRYLLGPPGIIPLGDHNSFDRLYNVWVGHASFDIGQEEARAIEDTRGVELLKVVTPYRFLVAFGKLFKTTEVKRAIEAAVCSAATKVGDAILAIEKAAALRFKHWAILCGADGKYRIVGGESENEVKEKMGDSAPIKMSWRKNGRQ